MRRTARRDEAPAVGGAVARHVCGKVEGEREKLEADLGPVRYLATLVGAGDQDVLR